ncbi:MAG: GNAT family N-acetyltransferase [Flavobacteriaceae bacterium]
MQLNYCPSKTDVELRQILSLQKKNLPRAISEEEKIKEGFVTVSHSFELLQRMHKVCPHTIVKDGESVVGYALSMHPKFGLEIEVLKPMFEEIKTIIPDNERYIVMGQICIAKRYRGLGIFRKLYAKMAELVKPNFDTIITEVDADNTRSLNAHYAIGFRDIKKYIAGGTEWCLISLK